MAIKIWPIFRRVYGKGYTGFKQGLHWKNSPYASPRDRKRDVQAQIRRAYDRYWCLGWFDAEQGRPRGHGLKLMVKS